MTGLSIYLCSIRVSSVAKKSYASFGFVALLFFGFGNGPRVFSVFKATATQVGSSQFDHRQSPLRPPFCPFL